jgi:phospholipase/lecithinase/hemolysin
MFAQLIAQQPRSGYWIWDGIHPTPAGHRRMADLWIKAFEETANK